MAVNEGELLWTPPDDRFADSHLQRYREWLAAEHHKKFEDYESLWRWSVSETEEFWSSIWAYFQVISDAPFRQVATGKEMIGQRWFEGSRVNFAEHALRYELRAAPDEIAIRHSSESRGWGSITWKELGNSVRRLATALRDLGIRPGDRVVSYMPNIPETAIAMLATTAIGAIWSAASPEFGPRAVVDRFSQISPRLMFVADGYSFGGKLFNRATEAAQIADELPSLETLVRLNYSGTESVTRSRRTDLDFSNLMAGRQVEAEEFRYERVPHDHPLWVLFSSGTTGLPKAIAHSHVGMVVEQLKVKSLQLNLSPRSRNFFHSTTGWMMWNSVVSSLLVGSSIVLYDGSPTFGGADALFRVASEGEATIFGASPTLIKTMMEQKMRPAERCDLSRLDTAVLVGSPALPETFAWFYTDVGPDLWVVSTSGGTELCSSLVGAVPGRPVYAGEIQGRQLGIDVHVWNETGDEVVGAVGELVVAKPFPTQPLFFWGDTDGRRYRESYFETYPGIWRHGDLLKINERGGCYIYGRSDSTLNRFGVRIGTAEIYRVMERIPDVADSLVVCCELPGGRFYMPLFVALKGNRDLDERVRSAIASRLREDASPRHVPDEIHQVPAIPYTLTGKKMEVPIRRMLMGADPSNVASRDAIADAHAFDWFVTFSRHLRLT